MLRTRFLGCLDTAKQKLLDMGFQDLVFEDALELLQSQVRGMEAQACCCCMLGLLQQLHACPW
jgi:hypothetical protein